MQYMKQITTHLLKGLCHAMDNFFEGVNILIITFCVCANGFQGLSKDISQPTTIINFLFSSLKLLNNF
jgi:hypothetical protein